MKALDWTVTPDDHGIRPAGPSDECFYCQIKVGGEHKLSCVIRTRTVVVKVTLDIVVRLPEYWDSDRIEFHYDKSSACKNNLVGELVELKKRMGPTDSCLCSAGEVAFVREATEEDEEYFQTFAKDRVP